MCYSLLPQFKKVELFIQFLRGWAQTTKIASVFRIKKEAQVLSRGFASLPEIL